MTFKKIMSIVEQYDDEEEILVSDEYWFDEYGSTMYANGDVGDMNHETHVEQLVTGTILGYFNLEIGDFGSFDLRDYEEKILEVLLDDIDEEKQEEYLEEFYDDPDKFIVDYIVRTFNEPKEKIEKMLNIRDARAYAIEEWGWSRVHGNSIEVNRLTQKQLKLVSRGIWNALDEEGKIFKTKDEVENLTTPLPNLLAKQTGNIILDDNFIKSVDMLLPDNNTIIEYDGIWHFKKVTEKHKFELQKKKDNLVNKYCKDNNIKLIRIKEERYHSNRKKTIQDIIT